MRNQLKKLRKIISKKYHDRFDKLIIVEPVGHEIIPKKSVNYDKIVPVHIEKSDRYKCHTCHQVIRYEQLELEQCPTCGDDGNLVVMCPNDHCNCNHQIVESIKYCDLCGEVVCPICGCHDVEGLSRVTGYLQAVNGWNSGKRQELADRHRYDVTGSKDIID